MDIGNQEEWHDSSRDTHDGWPVALTLNLARAAETPDATMSMHADSVAVGIGISWGSGTLVAGGGAVSAMQNQNGVRVELVTTTQGLKFTLGANGVDMKIKQ